MKYRSHVPVNINAFNGLWKRGNEDSCPQDHFTNCNNIVYIQNGFTWRPGFDAYRKYPDSKRTYTFVQETGESLLILSGNSIYDSGSATPFVPILTVDGMEDFGYVPFAGRAYLSPSDGNTGLEGEFVYVYEGDGTPARKAAGAAPTDAEGMLAASNSSTGNVELGIHVFGAVYETESGFLSEIGLDTLPTVNAPGNKLVALSNIPVSTDPAVIKVHIVATRAINPATYTGDTRGYAFFFIPGAIVDNGTTTLDVNFFDSELLEDATALQDLFAEIPAGAFLSTYHNRLLVGATFENISVIYVSNPGEPEAVNEIDGLLVLPLDGKPVTFGQEFRDTLYCGKQIRTFAFNDNEDVPTSWQMIILDQGIGTSVHGIATVLDSGGVNVDYLIMADYSGVVLFNGAYIRPELSWKINDLWLSLDRTLFKKLQILNDSVNKCLYIILPGGTLIFGDYSNGMTPKDIRWSPWSFDFLLTCGALFNTNTLILGTNT